MIAGIGVENLRSDRSGRKFRHAPRRSRPPDRSRQARGPGSVLRLRHRLAQHPRTQWIRSPKSRRVCRSITISGCTWMPPCRARPRSAQNSAHLQNGVELADSYNFNPHKWMFTNFDCNCFWVADRKALIQTLSILPEYLRNQATESGAVIDYRDWHIQLGRRFRSLKLWFVIRHYGVEGLQYHIRRHVDLAQQFAQLGALRPRFRAGCASPVEPGLLPPQSRRRGESVHHGSPQPQRRSLSHAHQAERKADAAAVRRPDQHTGQARRTGMEENSRGSGQINSGRVAQSCSNLPCHFS